MEQVLVVDDDASIRLILRNILAAAGYRVTEATDGAAALAQCRANMFNLALTDLKMPGGIDGMEVLATLQKEQPALPVIMLTGYGDVRLAVTAVKLGAFDFITKPFNPDELVAIVARAIAAGRLRVRINQLEKANIQLAQLVSISTAIIVGVDESGRVTEWNASAEKILGKSREQTMGQLLAACALSWDWDRIQPAMKTCLKQGGAVPIEDVAYVTPTGSHVFLGLTFHAIIDEQGRPAGFLLLGKDITERKILESQLVQAQKLESIGQMAAGIAHEINTPMQYVGDNVQFLQKAAGTYGACLETIKAQLGRYRGGAEARLALDEIEQALRLPDVLYLINEIQPAISQTLEGVARVNGIVQAMKLFAHPDTSDASQIDLNRALESTLVISRNEWKYVAEVETHYDPVLLPVECYAGELNQAFLNIMVNAAHAIADRSNGTGALGRITVTTRLNGDWAEVDIQDTGTGIPPEIQTKIYDPFFTTKKAGRGTGQGLAVVYAVIVKKHRGAISFTTVPQQGTTFHIRIPLTVNP
jgi:PAS domain S-box-containing protein